MPMKKIGVREHRKSSIFHTQVYFKQLEGIWVQLEFVL